jgi:hypothetical protein
VNAVMVVEIWHLKPEYARDALSIMQSMDAAVGPGAHADSGWCGHARFYQDQDHPGEVLMQYPWRSRASHEALTLAEQPLLAAFILRYCARPREIHYYGELPVDVEVGGAPGEARR